MSIKFEVHVANGRPKPIIFQNIFGKVAAVISVTNINTVANQDFWAEDDKGTLLFAPAVNKGESIAFSVPKSVKTVYLATADTRFAINAEVQIDM